MDKINYRFEKNVDNLATIQEKLDKCKIKIDFVEPYTGKISVVNLINHLFMPHPNYNHLTVVRPTNLITISTGRAWPQKLGTRRSIEDMYLLCKTYIPDVTLEQITAALKKKNCKLKYGCYCAQHGRHMYNVLSFMPSGVIPQEFQN